jgi:hypothetical protein
MHANGMRWILVGALGAGAALCACGEERVDALTSGGTGAGGAGPLTSAGVGAQGGASSSASSTGGAPPLCDPADAADIPIHGADFYGGTPFFLGYPPYAIDACTLVFVAKPVGTEAWGALVRRDLSSGNETILAPAAEGARRPSVAGDVVAWEATLGGKPVVRVRVGTAEPKTITGAFDHAGEPRAASDAVAFTAWLGADDAGDTDVLLYDVMKGETAVVGGGAGQQRFADVSATHVAYTDFAEDPDGTFDLDGDDLADVVIVPRAGGAAQVWAKPEKQAFPMLVGGKAGFLDWKGIHPEPKFGAYEIHFGDIAGGVAGAALVATVETEAPYVRPVARGTLVEWVQWKAGNAQLWRRPLDLSAPATPVSGAAGASLFSPSASDAITVLATGSAAGMKLVAVAR